MKQNLTNIENSIIASLLLVHEFEYINIDTIMNTGITKRWFSSEINSIIFDVVDVHYKAGKKYDNEIIIKYLVKNDIKNVEDVILDLISIKQTSQEILLEYINILKSNYHTTKLFELSKKTNEMLQSGTAPDVVTQLIQNTLNDFEFLNSNGYTRKLSDVRRERKSKPQATRIETGMPFIDTVLTDKHGNKGIKNEGLFFISGLKQSGKTYTLTRILENVSKRMPVMFGSLEFGEELYDEGVEDSQEDGFWDGDIENIFTFDSIYEVDAICAEIRFQVKINGVRLVALDSMMRITNNNPLLKTDERRLSEIFSKLGKLSKELKIPIIIIVQSSKEDLKSSIISVKGSMNADHEAFVWYHIFKVDSKNPEDERRCVLWNKNKDTHKHPKQYLMFIPQTKDFYQYEADEFGKPIKPLHNYRKPKYNPALPRYEAKQPIVTTFDDSLYAEMPDIDFD